MSIKIGGDTLALDADIRRQIESEAQKLEDRFTDERIETQATIQEEFDRLHGHRVRCELCIKLAQGRQVVVRDASKSANEAIAGVFGAARRSVRRVRWQGVLERAPATQSGDRAAEIASH
ncbi:HPF/RaiA family ribosome-associated protein [Marichromatium bheemlicum]|uniref:HPF/RaiA family ribosome-associated protein n=1 Tax=Marichromatium bheemlicum TaxID=365339 RepID=A0ABX1ID94_9GAMM|nr:HPF/RaiA family ribosome-associated protein [Marichromatium bheemlicum]NKN34152.1 HPF/RaiA family ribosome-associated protein [Marichromatium bheemlicum]